MNIAITIPCFHREAEFDRCLESLAANKEVKDGSIRVQIYPDFQDVNPIDGIFSKHKITGLVMTAAPFRFYGCLNILRSIRMAFACGYDRVIRMDSDLQVSPHFVRQVLALKDWAKMPSQSQIVCPNDILKEPYARDVVHGKQTGTNLVIDRHEWEKIAPMIDEYESLFLMVEPKLRDHVGYRKWFKDRVDMIPSNIPFRNAYVKGEAGMGADSLIFFALLANGMNVACLFVNRAIHISTYGENNDPASYKMLSAATLDVLESDATATDFKWID